jgi:hypothetical protein
MGRLGREEAAEWGARGCGRAGESRAEAAASLEQSWESEGLGQASTGLRVLQTQGFSWGWMCPIRGLLKIICYILSFGNLKIWQVKKIIISNSLSFRLAKLKIKVHTLTTHTETNDPSILVPVLSTPPQLRA